MPEWIWALITIAIIAIPIVYGVLKKSPRLSELPKLDGERELLRQNVKVLVHNKPYGKFSWPTGRLIITTHRVMIVLSLKDDPEVSESFELWGEEPYPPDDGTRRLFVRRSTIRLKDNTIAMSVGGPYCDGHTGVPKRLELESNDPALLQALRGGLGPTP